MIGPSPHVDYAIQTLEKKAKEDGMKIRKLEDQLVKAKEAPVVAAPAADSITSKQLEKQLGDQEKKLKKAFEEETKKKDRDLSSATNDLKRTTKSLEEATAELTTVKEERERLKKQVAEMGSMSQVRRSLVGCVGRGG